MAMPMIALIKIANNLAQINVTFTSLLKEIDQLIKNCKIRVFSHEATIAAAHILIEGLFSLHKIDLSLTIKRLCRLLKLKVEKVQHKAVLDLKLLFHSLQLANEVEKNLSQQLIALEKQVDKTITLKILSSLPRFRFSSIELYHGILERLWIFLHLIKDRNSYAFIIKENEPYIVSYIDQWLTIFSTKISKDTKSKIAMKSIHSMFQRKISCSPAIMRQIAQLKLPLMKVCPSIIKNICRTVRDYQHSIDHYKKNLDLLTFFKIKNILRYYLNTIEFKRYI